MLFTPYAFIFCLQLTQLQAELRPTGADYANAKYALCDYVLNLTGGIRQQIELNRTEPIVDSRIR